MQPPSEVLFLPAASATLARRTAVTNAVYADYYVPIHFTGDQLAAVERSHDVDLARSLVATAGKELIGIALLAVRGKRAWVGGLGVLPAWRRKGIARAMMVFLITALDDLGIRQVSLEVISQNAPALRLYEPLGFQIVRELLSWRRAGDSDPLPIPADRLSPAAPHILLANHEPWHDQPVCWQAARATLEQLSGRAKGYLLSRGGALSAYCLVNDVAETVWLLDMGVKPAEDVVTPARILIQALAAIYLGRPLAMVNLPADSVLSRVLAALRFLVVTRQLEMTLNLGAT